MKQKLKISFSCKLFSDFQEKWIYFQQFTSNNNLKPHSKLHNYTKTINWLILLWATIGGNNKIENTLLHAMFEWEWKKIGQRNVPIPQTNEFLKNLNDETT